MDTCGAMAALVFCDSVEAEAEGWAGGGCGGCCVTGGDAVSAVAKWRTGHSGVSENR